MARYIGPKNRLSRKEGLDLFGKGNKLRRATLPPGQHGAKGVRRISGFGQQLREKQKTKRLYGIMERQFHKYFVSSARSRGSTGERLLQLLETRLDNVVYRLGFTPTRTMARQLVSHGHVTVNQKPVNIPSYHVEVQDLVSLDQTALNIPVVSARLENVDMVVPAWLSRQGPIGKIDRLPVRADIDSPVTEQLIVEFYSR